MAETSHRNDPDWKDLADPVPLDSNDPELRAPAVPEDLPGSRSEMLPREESEALARMADATPETRPVKPDETNFFGYPPHLAQTTEPTLFDTSRSALQEAGALGRDASEPAPAAWDENEAALQERLRKWMEDARARAQSDEGAPESQGRELSPSLQRLKDMQRTMDPGAGSEPTLAESPEAHAKREAARLLAAPPAPTDPMATIMVPADQFLGALGTLGLSSASPDGAHNPPRKTFQRSAAGPRQMTREEALTRKIALLRQNAEGPDTGPAPLRFSPPEDKTLVAAAVALLAVIFVLALGLFAATQAGMFDGLESRFEFLRPDVSAEYVPAMTAPAGTAPRGPEAESQAEAPSSAAEAPASAAVAPAPKPAASAGRDGDFLRAYLQSAAKRDASNLLSLYGRYARRFPGLTGEVRMQLTIVPKGLIIGGNVVGSTTGVGEFDKAVLLRVMQWRLREFPGSSPRIVSFPLLFPLQGL